MNSNDQFIIFFLSLLADIPHALSIPSLDIVGIITGPLMILIVVLLIWLVVRVRKQKALLDELFEQNPEAAALLNNDNTIVHVNREFTSLFGYSAEECYGKTINELIVPDDLIDEEHKFDDVIARGERLDADGVRIRKDGRRLWVSMVRVPVAVTSGRIASCTLYRDITKRKRDQAMLQESEQRFIAFMENIPGHTWIKDSNGRFVYMSQSAAELTFHPNEWSGKTDNQLFTAEIAEEYRMNDQRVIATGKSIQTIEPYLTNGRQRYVMVSKFPIFDRRGAVAMVGGVSVDITEPIEVQKALQNSNEQLRALSARLQTVREEETTRIAREIHDELGSSLTSLKWDFERLGKQLVTPLSDLSVLHLKIELMTGVIDTTIEAVRRISSELRPRLLDELGLVEAINWQARQFQSRTGIACQFDSPPKVDLNREQSTAVFRILQEALTNVLRHARATCVEIALRAEPRGMVLTISDNGIGITEDQMSGGQSIGVLGMRERARLIGGDLDITGIGGKGTIIVLRAPVARAERARGWR
jgi:PAS domain S-box-containing protein